MVYQWLWSTHQLVIKHTPIGTVQEKPVDQNIPFFACPAHYKRALTLWYCSWDVALLVLSRWRLFLGPFGISSWPRVAFLVGPRTFGVQQVFPNRSKTASTQVQLFVRDFPRIDNYDLPSVINHHRNSDVSQGQRLQVPRVSGPNHLLESCHSCTNGRNSEQRCEAWHIGRW